MIEIVKKRKGHDKHLIVKDGEVVKSKDGLVISFRAKDNRKPSYFVLISNSELLG